MGGNKILNIGTPSDIADVANKAYVDSYFDQLIAQMQWLNGTISNDTAFSFTTNDLAQDIDILESVNPDPVNNTI